MLDERAGKDSRAGGNENSLDFSSQALLVLVEER